MWRSARCSCRFCPSCKHRIADQEWRERRRLGIPLTAEEKSRQAREAVNARWSRAKDDGSPEVSDEELDRRALEMDRRQECNA